MIPLGPIIVPFKHVNFFLFFFTGLYLPPKRPCQMTLSNSKSNLCKTPNPRCSFWPNDKVLVRFFLFNPISCSCGILAARLYLWMSAGCRFVGWLRRLCTLAGCEQKRGTWIHKETLTGIVSDVILAAAWDIVRRRSIAFLSQMKFCLHAATRWAALLYTLFGSLPSNSR